jgi:flagellar motor switch protein FliN/FliY
MSEAPTPDASPPVPERNPVSGPVQSWLQIWADSLAQVVGQIAGSAVPCTLAAEAPGGLAPAGAEDLWALVASSGNLRGEMFLRLAPATVLRLAQTFMSEPLAPEAALTADHREAVIELLRQIGGIVASSAKAAWGEIQLLVESAAAAPSWPPAETAWLLAGDEGPTRMALELGVSAALAAELRSPKSEPAGSAAVPGAAAAPVSAPAPAPAPAFDPAQSIGALNLLMDVQLAVTMRFGSRRLLLSEVLELSPGAVVELDRRVQEPVDLLLEGRLVAQGEVVVIDGNYGLRVTEVFPVAAQPGRNG